MMADRRADEEERNDPISRLAHSLSPYAWTEVTPTVVRGGRYGGEFLELLCRVKMPEEGLGATTDKDLRRYLFINAEAILAVVYRHGWRHVRVPQIEFDGDIEWRDGFRRGEPRCIHRCEVRLEVEYSGQWR